MSVDKFPAGDTELSTDGAVLKLISIEPSNK